MTQESPTSGKRRSRRFVRPRALWLLALFLIVLAARGWLIHEYARALPFWDQWDAEGELLLKPWLEGGLNWHGLVAPHNEHRIILTRLMALGLFIANGQWDGLVEMAVNAVFCGVSAVGIAWTLLRAFHPAWPRTIVLAVGAYFVLPFGWENTLCGFQSQVYFLVGFSLLSLWGLGMGQAGAARWWAGMVGVMLACLSMASGFLAAVAVLVMLGFRRIVEGRRFTAGRMITVALCVGIVAAGWASGTVVPGHAGLKAETLPSLLAAMGRFMAWPMRDPPWWAMFNLVPFGLLAAAYWRAHSSVAPRKRVAERNRLALLLGVALWAGLQTAALAYGRGGHGAWPVPRYLDLLALLPLTALLSWLALILWTRRTGWHGWTVAAAVLWTMLLVRQLGTLTYNDLHDQIGSRTDQLIQSEVNVRGYLATHDFARFLADKPFESIPFPDREHLAQLLDDPTLRRILPADIRLPLALGSPREIRSGSERAGFTPDGYDPACGEPPQTPVWGSYPRENGATEVDIHLIQAAPASPFPYLRFAFAGDLGGDEWVRFILHGMAASRPLFWKPVRAPRRHWRLDDLPNPGGGAMHLEARDASPTGWFAYSAPVEVAAGSHWTGYLLRRSHFLFLPAVLLLAAAEVLCWRRRSRRRAALPGWPDAPPLVLLTVVIPARNEEGSIAATVQTLHAELWQSGVPHEILVVNDGSTDGTLACLDTLRTQITPLRVVSNPGPHGFGRAIRFGLERMTGDAVVIMMADESDSPLDAVRYWQALKEGYDCVFGSRFGRGGIVDGYPRRKLLANRLANGFIRVLFGIPLDDTTNAFKAYRREVIDGCAPLISAHFNLTVELPLKAIVRGFRWTVIPVRWANRRAGVAKFRLAEMGSRYLFICLSVWLEKHLSRGDYRRAWPPSPSHGSRR